MGRHDGCVALVYAAGCSVGIDSMIVANGKPLKQDGFNDGCRWLGTETAETSSDIPNTTPLEDGGRLLNMHVLKRGDLLGDV